jgi:hypothetical protein
MLRLAAVLALSAVLAAVAALADVKTCGKLTHVKTAYDRPAAPFTTWSQVFVEIPNTRISFNIGGKGRSCVVVTYSARMQAATPGELWLNVVLDGKTPAEPGALVATMNGDGGSFTAQSFTWIFPAVRPGKRNIRVEFKSGNGSAVSLEQQTVLVQYR